MWIFPCRFLNRRKNEFLFKLVPLRLQPLWSSPRQSPALQTFPSKKRERRWGRGAEGEGGEEARSRERGGAQEGAVAICARGGLSSASSPRVLKWEGVQIPSLPSGLHFLPLKCKSLRHPRSLEGGGCATIVGGRQVMITVRVCNSFFFPQHKAGWGSKGSVRRGHRIVLWH